VFPDDLVYTDAANLKNLNELLQRLEQSSTYLLLLTKHVLERPWILTELCSAHALGKTIVLLRLSGKDSDTRSFDFPHDVESTVDDWRQYHEMLHQRSRHADQEVALRQKTRGLERFVRMWQGVQHPRTGTFRLHFLLERTGHAIRTWVGGVVGSCCHRYPKDEPPIQAPINTNLGAPQNIPPPRRASQAQQPDALEGQRQGKSRRGRSSMDRTSHEAALMV
jgi:hypothetical protein